MEVKTIEEFARERLNELSNAARQRFRGAVLPIYGVTCHGYPDHIGSAILLQLAEGPFLLTAAHVIDQNEGTSLYLGAEELVLIQVGVLATSPPDGDRAKDRFDFAFAPVGRSLSSQLTSAKPLKETDLLLSAGTTKARLYSCLGYPNSKNKVNPVGGKRITPALGIYTDLEGSGTDLPESASDDHIFVRHNHKYMRDERGARVSSTSLRGLSGGAIIDIGSASIEGMITEPDPKVAALLVGAYPEKKLIVGTKLTTILTAIRSHLRSTSITG